MRKFSKEATAEEQQLDTYETDDVGYAMHILNNAENNKRARIDKSKCLPRNTSQLHQTCVSVFLALRS